LYVTRAFHDAGCGLCAIVGTSEQSARAAKDELGTAGAQARIYGELKQALREERPDIVAVCSPYLLHREQLGCVAEIGAHCLCEKPLWWGPEMHSARETARLVDSFLEAGLLLDLLTQWPQTLASYDELFPQAAAEPLERFEMRLSPISSGPEMVPDAMPHVLSMMWALVKEPGEIASPKAAFGNGSRELTVDFDYRHPRGVTQVTARFVTCPEQPRPAWYGINGRVAERKIDMTAGYAMRLVDRHDEGGRSVALPDPLPMLVQQFVRELRAGQGTFNEPRRRHMRRERLINSVTQLATLYAVARDAAENIKSD
jgi:predicted dehydrogenase